MRKRMNHVTKMNDQVGVLRCYKLNSVACPAIRLFIDGIGR